MLYIVLLTKSALFLKLLCVWITYGNCAEALRASTITCSPLFSSLLTNTLATDEGFPVEEQKMRILTNKLATEEARFPCTRIENVLFLYKNRKCVFLYTYRKCVFWRINWPQRKKLGFPVHEQKMCLLTNKLATEEGSPVHEQKMRLLTNKLATEEGFPVQEQRIRLLTNKLATGEGFPVQEHRMRLAHALLAAD